MEQIPPPAPLHKKLLIHTRRFSSMAIYFTKLKRIPSHLLLFLIYLIESAPTSSIENASIPGCPNLELLEKASNFTPEALDNLLLCFCKVTDKKRVSVQCLYGSTLDQLQRVGNLISNNNKTLTSIHIQHMEFPTGGLKENTFYQIAPELESLEIRDCSGSSELKIDVKGFQKLKETLVNLTIHGCSLNEVPDALQNLHKLEFLDLSENKIMELTSKPFDNKSKLKYLDLSSNFINHAEMGTFSSLDGLETIILGDHNYLNQSVWEEVTNLKHLQNLDLTRADGVFSIPTDYFTNLTELVTLKLGGCSIENIDTGAFNSLQNLRELDLRVNMIVNVSAFAFDGLNRLKRLSLAGNFIRRIESVTWDGLESLEELDLGWNELEEISIDTFSALRKSLCVLNLRHNRFTKVDNITGMDNLKEINLSESEYLKEINANAFHELPHIQKIDISNSNLTSIDPKAFEKVKKNLQHLKLDKTKLKTIPSQLLQDLANLEEIDLSGNPLICNDELRTFIDTTKNRYKEAAKSGRNFFLENQNETICDRPYTLRGKAIFDLSPEDFQPYNEALDTTTIHAEITTEPANETLEETTSRFALPNLFVGLDSNDTFFHEDVPRPAYDVTKTDDLRLNTHDHEDHTAKWLALGGILFVTLLIIIAVIAYMKKKQKLGTSDQMKKIPKDDGMIEIELRSERGSIRQENQRQLQNLPPSTNRKC